MSKTSKNSAPQNQIAELADLSGLGMIPAHSLNGREFSDGKKDYIDFCTTNYLGFDFRPELHNKGTAYNKQWGSLTGWSRLEADPVIYSNLEKRISKFLGVKDTILSHTITITNFSLIPSIAEKGFIFCDSKVHTVVWEACRLARDHGAQLTRFKHQDMHDLEELLKKHKDVHPKVIAVDGVYSISTEFAPIRELQRLAEKYDAWLYVDDAHGFGVLGDSPSAVNLYGSGGKGIIAHAGGNYDRTFYVTSFGKAFCTHTAFATIPNKYTTHLRGRSMQYIFSAPMPPYTIGVVDATLDLNESEGDAARRDLLQVTKRFVDGLKSLNLQFSNNSFFPVVFWNIGTMDTLIEVAQKMIHSGVAAGIRAYPIVPADECGLRFGLTRLHTNAQIDKTLEIISSCQKIKAVKRAA